MYGDVVDLIMQDHREFERLFDELKSQPEKRPLLIPTLTTLLTAHSRAEEAEVYPPVRHEADGADEVEHSQEEHLEAEELLARLADTDPQSATFDEVLNELVESVTHHIEEEESTVLAVMRERMDDQRRAELGQAFADSRDQHMGDRPGEASREELEIQAKNVGISGASDMRKEELVEELNEYS